MTHGGLTEDSEILREYSQRIYRGLTCVSERAQRGLTENSERIHRVSYKIAEKPRYCMRIHGSLCVLGLGFKRVQHQTHT